MPEVFAGSFTQQEPIPEAGIEAAVAVMRHGRLHRYNTAGETAETALLEQEFARYTGARYCLAVASGGAAMRLALQAAGVGPGVQVLTNAFTLAPVPGAIAALGAEPVFVETTPALTIDLDDLAAKARPGMVLLLSHMRGHLADMDALMRLCDAAGVRVIEDCAHTMGAAWNGTPSGRHGLAGCYSTQTYKHMNSGEGGLIVSDDADLMARMVLLSGSYMLYDRHSAAPGPGAYEGLRETVPNVSSRMDNLRAAVLRPQIPLLADRVARWRARYEVIEAGLQNIPGLLTIARPAAETYVGSSFQFVLPGRDPAWIEAFLARTAARGVELKWFGRRAPMGFTSSHHSWRYAPQQALPQTDAVLSGLIDMRLPLTFSLDDCAQIARIIAAEATSNAPPPAGHLRQGD
ncbi:DegT/DnrJ/EryC1/StrS family aminotransferase [Gemmobacter nectariphilus]|uniref:DegT/DnrJ/EryC1/StrS family aminotransferase n=1 Tax=Gemmobacter nectariphilus TaxID=220343 RepID=UPI0004266A8B|nr:aminotransferase class I/II-fold pyridoxal phosphate-dependent enzyme [Gemmobacter nectariphilus]